MARIIKQVSGNNPTISGKIYQFGIQAPFKSRVVFNGDTNNVIFIGNTGIFQADLEEGSYLTSITVYSSDLDMKCYIDVIMEEGS